MDDKILEAFSFGRIQDCRNIKAKLDEYNISWDEFIDWADNRAKLIESIPRPKVPNPPRMVLKRKCPECGSWLKLGEVNHSPCAMVDGGYHSQWLCPKCEWEEFTNKELEKEAEPFLEELNVIYVPIKQKSNKPCKGCK
jgi:predicted nucleic-acid-binding Zn-ribbon protein